MMDEENRSVSENGVENFKMAERTSMFTTTVRTALQNLMLTQNESRHCLWKSDDSKFEF